MSEEKPKKERKKKDPAPADGHPAPKRGGESRERKKNWKEYMANITRIKASDKKSSEVSKKKVAKLSRKATKAKKEKKPMGKFGKIITAPFRYIHESWLEIRQVRWPNRKATWKLVGAIFVYAAFFIVFIMLLDALFNFIFSKIIG